MPCNSKYLEPTQAEVNASKVLALLEELKTGELPDYYGVGTYAKVYNKNANEILENAVPQLCSLMQNIEKQEPDLSIYSLELQIWWRDHKRADAERMAQELLKIKEKEERDAAIAKLTPYERNLLGIS